MLQGKIRGYFAIRVFTDRAAKGQGLFPVTPNESLTIEPRAKLFIPFPNRAFICRTLTRLNNGNIKL